MSTKSTYIQPTYGFFGALSAIWNAIGATAQACNNVAAGTEQVTAALPELGYDAGQLMASRAKANLANQLKLQEQA